MNCDAYTEAIGDLVDGRLDAVRQRDLDRHLEACASCRTLVADLARIREAAAHLPEHRPPDRVWARLAAQLPRPEQTPARAAAPRASLFESFRWGFAWRAGLVMAAAALLLVAALPYLRPAGAPQVAAGTGAAAVTPAAVHLAPTDPVQAVESELRLAEEHFENAIAGMERLAKEGEGTLDPQLAGTLRRNLSVIDQAITESRSALKSQPTNELAQESLFEAFRRKVGLLQDTVALINEMRKGNQAETARIIGNMQKS